MLVLTRHVGEITHLTTSDGPVEIVLVSIGTCNRVQIGVDAPRSVKIVRAELLDKDETCHA